MRVSLKRYAVWSGILFVGGLFLNGLRFWLLKQAGNWDEAAHIRETYAANITEDMKCFPIPLVYRSGIDYTDTYGAARNSGGHEGCDIMDCDNRAGEIPVVSATDGVITNVGWLYLGGYRIGITSEHDIYYYYAHLDSYAAGITAGRTIQAGELLGFMGNTGEGEEGTKGKFPVHLHFGIYVQNRDGNEESVNSYPFLRKIDEQ
ncbi:MAG: M23 family metallopeptidase [Lachnospiraceae bacterium]|nr:M23 family metallopeptidase [Lachnospiraceae bacterium]